MTREDLRRRLRGLVLGETAMLTRSQFAEVFAEGGSTAADEQKLAAAELAEGEGCRVLFTGEETIFALFTRRQNRRDLRLDPP
jgi:hypothetical protein